jgi:hypothetical protein
VPKTLGLSWLLGTRAQTASAAVRLGIDLNHPEPMGQRLIISDNRDDPGNPLILDGEAIDAAADDPLAIGKLMVDQVWAEGTDPTGGGLYYERNSNRHRRLQAFETGSEDFMTGGWVRVLASAEQVRKERPGMERAAKAGLVRIHGIHRGVLLVEFLDVPWD